MPIYGSPQKVGTANKAGNVEIIGKVRPFFLYFESVQTAVRVEPHVARGLAHPVNLGQDFLRRNEADLSFRAKDVQLKIKGKCAALVPGSSSLTRPSVDARFIKVLDTWKERGCNPPECQDVLDARIHNVFTPEHDLEPDELPGLWKNDYKRVVHIHETHRKVNPLNVPEEGSHDADSQANKSTVSQPLQQHDRQPFYIYKEFLRLQK